MNRHDKPYRCTTVGCTRAEEGFATKNDLGRHCKTVHKVVADNCNERSFICQGSNCNHRNKVWPRYDNFKAHCSRRHKSEMLDELIGRLELPLSRLRPQPRDG